MSDDLSADIEVPRQREWVSDRAYIVWDDDTAAAFTPSDVDGDYVEGVPCACGAADVDPRDPDHAGHRIPPVSTEEADRG